MARKKTVVLVLTEEESTLLIDSLRECSNTRREAENQQKVLDPKIVAIDALLVKALHAERQKK